LKQFINGNEERFIINRKTFKRGENFVPEMKVYQKTIKELYNVKK